MQWRLLTSKNKRNEKIISAFVVCITLCVPALSSYKNDCDCNQCKEKCSCDKDNCNCEETFYKNLPFHHSNWGGTDKNNKEVLLEIDDPKMTLTYYEKAQSKKTFNFNKVIICTDKYSYDPESGKFKDAISNRISGVVTNESTLNLDFADGIIQLTKK